MSSSPCCHCAYFIFLYRSYVGYYHTNTHTRTQDTVCQNMPKCENRATNNGIRAQNIPPPSLFVCLLHHLESLSFVSSSHTYPHTHSACAKRVVSIFILTSRYDNLRTCTSLYTDSTGTTVLYQTDRP